MAKGKKTGGRVLGVPNKEKPEREILKPHTKRYFLPNPNNENGESDFERDMKALTPAQRIDAEIRLLKFTVPELKSIDLEATIATGFTIEDRLRQLSDEEDE